MKKIRLFLSSPGDMETERQKVRPIVDQINRMLGDVYHIHIDVIDWKTHVAPDLGRAQELINRQVGDYDIFVGMMWKRFGTPTGEADSGTEEEFNIAYNNWQKFQRPRIMFYFSKAKYNIENDDEIDQLAKVIAFKKKLQKKGLIWEYKSPDEFGYALRDHLAKVLHDWFAPREKVRPVADFTRYLKYLKTDTMYIDIRGLVTGEGKVHQFRIDQLYIPLKTTSTGMMDQKQAKGRKPAAEEMLPREVDLPEALRHSRLIIKGDPGAGKTTFLRLVTFTLCQKWLTEIPGQGSVKILWTDPAPLPIFIRLGRLTEHIRACKENDPSHSPVSDDSPDCLLRFLVDQSAEFNWGLTADDFRRELQAGHCLILLDGLDEAPDDRTRESVSNLAANLLKAFPDCRIVLTSRPAALVGEAFPHGFELVEIAPLDDPAMQTFLTQWCTSLYADAPEMMQKYQRELGEALQARLEIRNMARTPVMLTALAVVHWNENRLPEQRAELYESIITWLVRSRKDRPGRQKADRCRKLLQKLALGMFTYPGGRLRQIGPGDAAAILAPEFEKDKSHSAREWAEYFLRDEMVDSGIIVERGKRLEFWHLSFQEYLAAYEIAGKEDSEQTEILFEKDRLYSSEWRELVLLLSGVLYKQGEAKINHLIDDIMGQCLKPASHKNLPQIARTVALLGGMVRDLSPFDFKPANPNYHTITQSVMGIFEPQTFRQIPVQVRIQAADALAKVGDTRLEPAPMILIPGGKFWMGAQKKDRKGRNYDPDEYGDESPVHEVELSPFRFSKYPVTVGQYQRFIQDDGYKNKKFWLNGKFDEFKAPDKWQEQLQYPSRPVVYVSWYEAAAYCCWAKGRLPTEAEWERAARGPGQDYHKYPWGNKEPDPETANFDDSKINHVTPVGIFPGSCSPEGVIDLAGNVWEWCWDWYDKQYYDRCFRQGIINNPRGPEKGDSRVVRGGSFLSDYGYRLRCAVRDVWYPRYRGLYVGFRVVCGA
ncbi:NACHT domain-containing protein [candidate division KSB1 bacterium]|nr:MAG: NACHT domain-containing protein [candidate division KSB1 bacterium]